MSINQARRIAPNAAGDDTPSAIAQRKLAQFPNPDRRASVMIFLQGAVRPAPLRRVKYFRRVTSSRFGAATANKRMTRIGRSALKLTN